MDSTKAEAENIEPSAGKELLDKYWTQVKHEIDDINIVRRQKIYFYFHFLMTHFVFRLNFVRLIYR